MQDELRKLQKENEELQKECIRFQQWVNDLQSGMYINCVYCGHRYGPEDKVPVSMADVLKEHVEQCPEHPMSKLKKEYLELLKLHVETVRGLEEKLLEVIKDVRKNKDG